MNKLLLILAFATGCATLPVRDSNEQATDHSDIYRENGRWPGSPVVKTLLGGSMTLGQGGSFTGTPLNLTGASAQVFFNNTAANNQITASTSAANAGATPTTSMLSIYPQNALDATDWVFNIGNQSNGTSLFHTDYSGNATASGTVSATIANASQFNVNGTFFMTSTAPVIGSGFGTSPAIAANTGSNSFEVNVGTGGVATSGVITLGGTAAHGWNCVCQDITTPGANITRMTANSTTQCTVTNVAMSTGSAAAWTASDKLWCTANPM